MRLTIRRSRHLAVLASALAASLGCGGGSGSEPELLQIAAVSARVRVVEAGGEVFPWLGIPVGIGPSGAVTIVVEFLRADGSLDPAVSADAFELEATGPTMLKFDRTGAFSGTLYATTPGQAMLAYALRRRADRRIVLGPFNTTVTAVTEPTGVATLRIRIGDEFLVIDTRTGVVTGPTITLRTDAPKDVQWSVAGEGGAPVVGIDREYQQIRLEVDPSTPFVRFETNHLSPRLVALEPGRTVQLRASLWHAPLRHADFGPFPITVTTAAP